MSNNGSRSAAVSLCVQALLCLSIASLTGCSENAQAPPQARPTAVVKAPAPQAEARASSLPVKKPADEFPPLAALPEPPVPQDNPLSPAKVALGKLLFFDTRLSGDTSTSCATCHEPALGWGDAQELSLGYPGTLHWRNSQTVINSAYLAKLFWAGESMSLEAQAHSAIAGNLAGNADPATVEERLAQAPEYRRLFKEAFGVTRPTYDLALKAIASFERTLNSTDSAFDRYMRGEADAMSSKALHGKELFEGKARCIVCHNGPLLTDERYHNLGVPPSSLFESDKLHQISLRYQHFIRGVPEEVYRQADRDLGLYYTTKRDEDRGKFRTPPLRYLVFTAPYMHNGALSSLEDVIDFYDRGGGDDPHKSDLLRPLNLTPTEKSHLIRFLEALSGSEMYIEPPDLPPYTAFDSETLETTVK